MNKTALLEANNSTGLLQGLQNATKANDLLVSTTVAPAPKDSHTIILLKELIKGSILGGATGAFEILCTYPLEFAKTQLQLDEKGEEKKFKGTYHCLKETIRVHGICAPYSGMTTLFIGAIPKNGSRFGGYESIKTFFVRKEGIMPWYGSMVSGMAGGITEAVLVVTPMETIKVKMINDQRLEEPRYRNFCHGLKLIFKEEGVKGMYKGLLATVIRQSSNQAVRFLVVNNGKEWYTGGRPKTTPSGIAALIGIVAGFVSVYANNPIDVVKTRLQGYQSEKYKSTWDCCVQIWVNEGPLAFYKGCIPRLSLVCLNTGITFGLYQLFNNAFHYLFPNW